jgi:L-aspartate oxidase
MRETDFVIVGGGIAGLRAAAALAPEGRVVVLTKADPNESNTGYAQGGIAAAIGDDDSPELHAADTIRAGDGLCDEDAVLVLVSEGPGYVRELLEWGTRFDRDAGGRLSLGREAAHSVRRVLHAGDATGREIGRMLWQRVAGLTSVKTINHALVTELLIERDCAVGVAFFDAAGVRHELRAAATLLATGGAGQVFRETTNPSVATGDGVSLAFHAGACVGDLEFVQFHPTALKKAGAPRFLISEALRGEGARLINAHGERFMKRYDPAGDLAPRDVVARSIVREEERCGGPICLTLAHLNADFVRTRFPTITEMCQRSGLDLARDPIPVGPAAHYIMGGVVTDVWGRTSLAGLFAAGEVACTGVHGANRLASNSLLEGLVFGARAGAAMQQPGRPGEMKPDRVRARQEPAAGSPPPPSPLAFDEVRDLMWRAAGLFRDEGGLSAAADRLDAAGTAALQGPLQDLDSWRQLHIATVGRLIVRAALRRTESRGGHFRQDFPGRDDRDWKIHVVETRSADEGPRVKAH